MCRDKAKSLGDGCLQNALETEEGVIPPIKEMPEVFREGWLAFHRE